MISFEINQISDLAQAGEKILQTFPRQTLFCLEGEMGAGKTTFVREWLQHLGVKDQVNSPTYSIINEYKDPQGKSIYHFDCYRLKNLEEAVDIGIEDYLYSGNFCFIEWPDKIEQLLPENFVKISIEIKGDKRYIYAS